ncbi:hypothetical protein D3C78_1125910 [compost metagenome]
MVAIYRPTDVTASGNVSLRIDNTAWSGWNSPGYLAKVALIEDVTDINNYNLIYEQRWPATKRYSNGRWDFIGDHQLFYFIPAYAAMNYQFVYSFGYIKSIRAGDRYHALLSHYPLSASDGSRIWANSTGGSLLYGNSFPVFDNQSYQVLARAHHQLFGVTTPWFKGVFSRFGVGLNLPNAPDNALYISTDPILVMETGNHLRGYLPGLVVPYADMPVWARKNFTNLPALPGKIMRFLRVGYAENQNPSGQLTTMGFDLTGPWR